MSWVVTAYLLTQTIATILGGKFGDLFGRKSIFIGSIVLFTVASMLAGLSQSMTWLIASRALQGIGGGGLTITATAMIADIIPLRERGKYQGAMGAVFGGTTVLGPLLGGFFTDHLSWQWVFYVNVPIALVIIPLAVRLLPSVPTSGRPIFDTFGIVFISLGSAALILATSWGGSEYGWGSPTIIGLVVGGVVFLGCFVVAEHRAAEPILPLRLFRRNVFSVSSVLSFIVGFALLGCMTFLPTYLQFCQGVSATVSGLRTLPMVLGLIVASVGAGNVVSKTGRYRVFPIVGSVVMAVGMWLLSRLDQHSTTLETSGAMLVLGVGIGLSMQVLTIIVQNTVEYRDLGVATSGVTFFRTMGSSFGAAAFGTLYANQLAPNLAKAVAATGADPTQVTSPAAVQALPPVAAGRGRGGVRRHPSVRVRLRDPRRRARLRGRAVPQAGGDAGADPAGRLRDRAGLRDPRPAHRAGAARGPGRADPADPVARGRRDGCSSPRSPASTASRSGPCARSRSSRSTCTARRTPTTSPPPTGCRWP